MGSTDREIPEDAKLLFGIVSKADGVCEVTFNQYEIRLKRGRVFTREFVLKGVMGMLAAYYNDETPEQLPDIRSDIEYRKCPECARVQEEMWRGIATDMPHLWADE